MSNVTPIDSARPRKPRVRKAALPPGNSLCGSYTEETISRVLYVTQFLQCADLKDVAGDSKIECGRYWINDVLVTALEYAETQASADRCELIALRAAKV